MVIATHAWAGSGGAIRRAALVALALALGGWWWGSARLEAIDVSPLSAEIGRAARSRVVVTGPARLTRFEVRVPARMERFGQLVAREPILLELPRGRSPPQGAVLDVVGVLAEPSGPEDGFDERSWLRRHGIHVILRAERWRLVAHRGGIGGLADGIRAHIAASLDRGAEGERRALLAGIVLGQDEGLSEGLRDRFRASGLYHLLRKYQQAHKEVGCADAAGGHPAPTRSAAPHRRGGDKLLHPRAGDPQLENRKAD